MDLTLNVTRKENISVLILVKMMCKLHCQIDADFEKGLIAMRNLNDNFAESLLNEIDRVFEIKGIQIIPDNDYMSKDEFSDGEATQESADDYAGEDNLSNGEVTQEPNDDYTGEDSFSDGESAQEPDDDYAGEDNLSDDEVAQESDDATTDSESIENMVNSVSKDSVETVQFGEFLNDAFADTLSAINKNGTLEKKIYDFFEAIDFCQHDIVIVLFIRLFLVAYETTDVNNYDAICFGLRNKYGDMYDADDIKVIARNKFSEWLDNHPVFKEKYPNATIIDLIKFFVNFAY